MASATTTRDPNHLSHHNPFHSITTNLCSFLHSSSLIPFHTPKSPTTTTTTTTPPSPPLSASPSNICVSLPFTESPLQALSLSSSSSFESTQSNSLFSEQSSPLGSASGFPSSVRISSLNSAGKGGPAFVGQVFSMCDLSGTGLMAVSTHFDIPFISQRTPQWVKKMFAAVTKSERKGPVFRFFMDLGDAVSYVKRLNIPSGVVGACRLDLAYEHFKEKPHLFQFVPNEKQVKEANKLLKTMPPGSDKKSVDGVPVFSAQNLDIAIATTDGIKWYTPYFFDKNMLDNILEESVDQHFHGLIQTRNLQRRRDIIDDSLSADISEETAESMWEPPEVQEVLDEVGHPAIPLSVISKAAEIQLLHAVDRIMLGNRWLRKATGIQPKFPYVVDSFEKRSTTSLLRAAESSNFLSNSDSENAKSLQHSSPPEPTSKDSVLPEKGLSPSFRFPFGDWSKHPFSRRQQHHHDLLEKRVEVLSPLLPKITMVGVSSGESGQPSKANLKKTMEDLTRELEQTDKSDLSGSKRTESQFEDRDPLFVANVGDYYGATKSGSGRWVRGGIN